MTPLKHLPLVRAFALLTLLSIAPTGTHANTVSKGIGSNATNLLTSLQGSDPAKSERRATREELVRLGNAIAKCPKSPQPCSNIFGATEIASWIQNDHWRADGREGNSKFNFDDFISFHRIYGNAFGKPVTHPDLNVWVFNGADLITDHDFLDLESTEPSELPAIPTEIEISKFAARLASLMSPKHDGKVGVNDFVNFMLRRQ